MDIEKSTRAAIAYLKDLHAMFGDWLTVLAGYNCGEGRVMRTIASQQINYLDRFWDLYQKLPNETARYVPRFIATLLIVKDPAMYGFDFSAEAAKYDVSAYDAVETTRSMRLHDIASKLEISEENLCILNGELRHKTTPNKPYKLKVPCGSSERLLQLAADIPDADIPRPSYRTVKGVFIKHKVRKGETLADVADKYKTSVSSIRSVNKLSKKGLYAGQKLNIPITKSQVVASADNAQSTAKASVHKVKKGDTLSEISNMYRISVADLKKINNLGSGILKIGQTIRLSQKEDKGGGKKASASQGKKSTAMTYKVKKGDNLARIAKKNGVALQKLLTLNQMTTNDDIHPGQEIVLQ
jgi:membrane-bound lytic murein transglycosylase D